MRIRRILIPLLLLILLGTLSCKGKAKSSKQLIIVSIYPWELVLKELVGEDIEVRSIIPPDASPHTWSPKPADLAALQNADLVISNGLGLETNLLSAFESRGDKHISMAKLLALNEVYGCSCMHDEDDHNEENDPHIWTSPSILLRSVIALTDILQSHFPQIADKIKDNGHRMASSITAAHQRIMQERLAIHNPAVVTFHDSFRYFLDAYNIEFVGAVQSSPGKEPTPKELAELGKRIKAKNVKAIFVEPQMNRQPAEILATEFDLKLVEIDPMGYTIKATTIAEFLIGNWERMKLGLK
ncbi:MAG: metal ABC transporter substrate-binding protein [Candidatus Cloacimonadaceae bacterium]|nr:metal ABC transporter substrate-binding protein [Candidatus Cloacimonadaceae bacterium]